jgi:hypothetical protein
MENIIVKNTAEELKKKLAGWLFSRQNHRDGNDGFYVQAYLDQIWQSIRLNRKQKAIIKRVYGEMIRDGYLNIESADSSSFDLFEDRESESRICLTNEGICHYIYAYE